MKILKNIILVVLMFFVITLLSLFGFFSDFAGIITILLLCSICSALIFLVLQDKGETSAIAKINKLSLIGIVLSTVISIIPNMGLEAGLSVIALYIIFGISLITYLVTYKQMKVFNAKTNVVFLVMGIISLVFYLFIVILWPLFIAAFLPILGAALGSMFGIPYDMNSHGILFSLTFKEFIFSMRSFIYIILAIIFFVMYFVLKNKKKTAYQTNKIKSIYCNKCGFRVGPDDMFCNHCGYKLDNVEQYNASPNSNAQQTYAQHNNNADSSNNGKYSTAAKIIISITIIAIIVIITVLSTLFVQNIFNKDENNSISSNFNDETNKVDATINNDFNGTNNILDNSNPPIYQGNNTISKYQIIGNSWLEQTYNSLLDLNFDGTFKYYQNNSNLTDNYYEGTYEIYVGAEAIKYITVDLEKYGVTYEELNEVFARNSQYSEENFLCIVLTNNKCIIDGQNTLTNTVEVPYFGFYLDNDILNIANMNAGNSTYFTKQNN